MNRLAVQAHSKARNKATKNKTRGFALNQLATDEVEIRSCSAGEAGESFDVPGRGRIGSQRGAVAAGVTNDVYSHFDGSAPLEQGQSSRFSLFGREAGVNSQRVCTAILLPCGDQLAG
jgi:hypothetical protein